MDKLQRQSLIYDKAKTKLKLDSEGNLVWPMGSHDSRISLYGNQLKRISLLVFKSNKPRSWNMLTFINEIDVSGRAGTSNWAMHKKPLVLRSKWDTYSDERKLNVLNELIKERIQAASGYKVVDHSHLIRIGLLIYTKQQLIRDSETLNHFESESNDFLSDDLILKKNMKKELKLAKKQQKRLLASNPTKSMAFKENVNNAEPTKPYLSRFRKIVP